MGTTSLILKQLNGENISSDIAPSFLSNAETTTSNAELKPGTPTYNQKQLNKDELLKLLSAQPSLSIGSK